MLTAAIVEPLGARQDALAADPRGSGLDGAAAEAELGALLDRLGLSPTGSVSPDSRRFAPRPR